ncbi:hypothetical protein T01_9509 [Trichinella spiralis]|uniref:Uncharacterized protein n=1 Tax=Trichinella spiralis TaxID=6334 RepID=A0A0V0YXD9_TRISP|nr:hypothetical protein T01_9509 [Trichinella spiralis]
MGTDTAECTSSDTEFVLYPKSMGAITSLHRDVKPGNNIFLISQSSQRVLCL